MLASAAMRVDSLGLAALDGAMATVQRNAAVFDAPQEEGWGRLQRARLQRARLQRAR